MTSREKRGGGRVPDGIPRPESIPFAQGANRSDLSQLPGTPGTTLPGPQSTVPHGSAGNIRRVLSQIPIDRFQPGKSNLRGPTERPQEPISAGSINGPGVGPEGLIQSPDLLGNKLAVQETAYFYPILARLAALPGATTQTKILAQRMRANLEVPPEMMPLTPLERRDQEIGVSRETGESG